MKKLVFPLLQETYYEEILSNGLTVRIVPRPGFAKKYAFMAVNYGSIDTSYQKSGQVFHSPAGVAHYLEHKMFDLPGGNAMQKFAAFGGSDNAFTSYSMTAYYFDCVDHFQENLETLIEMVSTPYFTPESVEKERGIIEQEIRMYEDSPSSIVYENLFAAMYRSHPVRIPIAGSVESVAEITADTLHACYDAFYTPGNMLLCVVGDVDAQLVVDTARRLLPEEASEIAVPDYGAEESLLPPQPRISCEMEVSMPAFQIGFACQPPKPGQEVLRQEIVADLAAEVLVGESSPLYTKLYEMGLIDSGFGCGYEGLKGIGMLSAGGDSTDPDAVLSHILEEAKRLQRDGIDPDLFVRLKRAAVGSRIRELDSFDGIAIRLCGYFFEGAEYYDFPAVYEQVNESDVLDFLTRVVTPEHAAISIVYPLRKEESQ